MNISHPKSTRRRILLRLYESYQIDPLLMLSPEDLLEDPRIEKEHLVHNMHYLHDSKLVELMLSYRPPMFASTRITAAGIDLVENHSAFNLRFPPDPNDFEATHSHIPILMERLVEEVELSPLDGEIRMALLRDVQYLREEIARPVERWRSHVIQQVLHWLAGPFKDDVDEWLPSLATIRKKIAEELRL